MSAQPQPAQLPVQQTNYPQTTVGQPVMLAPGQQLMYVPGQQGVPLAGQPAYVQGGPGQPAPQYQMAPGQQAMGGQPQFGFNLTFDLSYLKSQPAILKYIEMLILLLAFATALKFKEIYNTRTRSTIQTDEFLEFFLGATISGWVMCILIVFALLLGFNKSCGVPTNPVVLVALFHMAWVVMLGGGSGALAYRANQVLDPYQKLGITLSQLREPLKTQINCLLAAVVFGFMAFALFIVDVILHHRMYSAMTIPNQPIGVVPYQQFPTQQFPGNQQVAVAAPTGDQQNTTKQQED